jgi:hypothetical protein
VQISNFRCADEGDMQILNFRCADDEKLKFDYRRDY